MGWELWRDGQSVESLSTGGFRLPLASGFKAVLRELLWSYVHALALLVPVFGVALGGMAWRRLKGRSPVLREEEAAQPGRPIRVIKDSLGHPPNPLPGQEGGENISGGHPQTPAIPMCRDWTPVFQQPASGGERL